MAEKAELCSVLLEVARRIAAAADLDAVLQLIAESATSLTGARASSISLLDASGRRLRIAAAFGLTKELLEAGALEVDRDPLASEVLRGKTVLIPDIELDERVVLRQMLLDLDMRSLAALELVAGERPLGMMVVYKSAPGPFSDESLDVLKTLASLGSVGIESARMYERVYRRCADLAVLNQIAEEINASLRTEEVLNAIVREVPKFLNAHACSVRLFDAKARKMIPVASFGLVKGLLIKSPINLEDSPLDDEALKGQVATVVDVFADARWRYPERAREEGIASAAVAPMSVKGKPVGTLWIYSKEPRVLTEEEKSLFKAIARHSAIAIENARLYELSVKTHDQLVQEVWRGLPAVWGAITGERRAA